MQFRLAFFSIEDAFSLLHVSPVKPPDLAELVAGLSAKAFLMPLNIEEMIEPMAKAVELAIPVEARAGVAASLQRLAEAADAVMSFPLSQDIEIAQVFVP